MANLEIGRMYSMSCNNLIYRKDSPLLCARSKFVKMALRYPFKGERPLLLRKECRVDFRRKWLLERFLVTEGAFLLIVILSNLQLLGFEETFLFLPPQNLVQIFGLKEHTEKDTHKPAQRYFVGQDALLLTILFSNTCISAPRRKRFQTAHGRELKS